MLRGRLPGRVGVGRLWLRRPCPSILRCCRGSVLLRCVALRRLCVALRWLCVGGWWVRLPLSGRLLVAVRLPAELESANRSPARASSPQRREALPAEASAGRCPLLAAEAGRWLLQCSLLPHTLAAFEMRCHTHAAIRGSSEQASPCAAIVGLQRATHQPCRPPSRSKQAHQTLPAVAGRQK